MRTPLDGMEILVRLRADGWAVAVHNDYMLDGLPHTFWLFTRSDKRWIKGEGRSDESALRAAFEQSQMPDVRGGLLTAKLTAESERDRLREQLRVAVEALQAAQEDICSEYCNETMNRHGVGCTNARRALAAIEGMGVGR